MHKRNKDKQGKQKQGHALLHQTFLWSILPLNVSSSRKHAAIHGGTGQQGHRGAFGRPGEAGRGGEERRKVLLRGAFRH